LYGTVLAQQGLDEDPEFFWKEFFWIVLMFIL